MKWSVSLSLPLSFHLYPYPLLAFNLFIQIYFVCMSVCLMGDHKHTWYPWMSMGENAGMTYWPAYLAGTLCF